MENIVFATYVTNDDWKIKCAIPLRKSFKKFHKNLPFIIFQSNQVNNIFDTNPNRNIRFSKPLLGKQLTDKYKKIILLDADQLIVGPLDELIEDNSDLAGVRSNDDGGMSIPCWAFETPKIPWQKYLNCGLCSVKNHNAFDLWDKLNRTITPYMKDAEQGTWNELFYSKQFTTTLLDPVNSSVIYGTAANSHHWNRLYIDDKERIILNLTGIPKHVKILHRAGVGRIGSPDDKFRRNMFSKEIANYLDRLTS